MAKKQDFASKVKKQSMIGTVCPTCDNAYTYIKKIESLYSEETQSWKYNTQTVKVCQCNEKEVYA